MVSIKFYKITALILACMIAMSGSASAGEVDILVRKLVEKGILTAGEAQQIMTETKEEARTQIAKGESPSVPQWTQNIKLKGDFRGRYQYQERGTGTTKEPIDRHRARIRLRLGADCKVNDKVMVGAGLATGSDADPRSTNQTLQDSFSKKPIWLDYAYGQYQPFGCLSLTGGKFKNPIWTPQSDLLWDSDINPEGVAANYSYAVCGCPKVDLFTNTGFFIIDEGSGWTADPVMWAIQPGFNWGITDKISLKSSFNGYLMSGLEGKTPDWTTSTNTYNTAPLTGLKYNYSSYGASGELGVKEPFGKKGLCSYFPYIGAFADFITNPDPSSDNDGWLVGGRIGYEKVSNANEWQAKYSYRKLEKDAWLDFLPDSDFYGGETGVKGHEVIFEYGLGKNVWLAFDYYRTENLYGTKKKEDLFQADVNLKF